MRTTLHILALDDDPLMPGLYGKLAKGIETDVVWIFCETQAEAKERVKDAVFDLYLIDLRLQGDPEQGFEFLRYIKQSDPEAVCIIVSAEKSFSCAQKALRLGADDYLCKGFGQEEFLFAIERALRERQRKRLQKRLSREASVAAKRYEILGHSHSILKLREQIRKLADKDVPVLILAETGTGKELVARNLHLQSTRREESFVPLDCASIPTGMAEGYLFGHERGAFTGAERMGIGILEQANEGTLFLDEVGTLGWELQAKFLRVLQEKEFKRLGSTKVLKANFRLVSAANQDLEAMIKEGKFKEDFFYRLNGVALSIPPLRERVEDIPLLLESLLPKRGISEALKKIFMQYPWPGNVRELKHTLMAVEALSEEGAEVDVADLPETTLKKFLKSQDESPKVEWEYAETKRIRDREFLQRAYLAAQGNVSQMARVLNLDRSHLHHKLKELGIHKPRP